MLENSKIVFTKYKEKIYTGFEIFFPSKNTNVIFKLSETNHYKIPIFYIGGHALNRKGNVWLEGAIHDRIFNIIPDLEDFWELHDCDFLGREFYLGPYLFDVYHDTYIKKISDESKYSENIVAAIINENKTGRHGYIQNHFLPTFEKNKKMADAFIEILSSFENIEPYLPKIKYSINSIGKSKKELYEYLDSLKNTSGSLELTESLILKESLLIFVKNSKNEILSVQDFFQKHLPMTYASIKLQEIPLENTMIFLEEKCKEFGLKTSWTIDSEKNDEQMPGY